MGSKSEGPCSILCIVAAAESAAVEAMRAHGMPDFATSMTLSIVADIMQARSLLLGRVFSIGQDTDGGGLAHDPPGPGPGPE